MPRRFPGGSAALRTPGRRRRARASLVAVLCALASAPSPTAAQVVDVGYALAFAGRGDAMNRPRGPRITVVLPAWSGAVGGWLRLRAEYFRGTEDRSFLGTACQGLVPPDASCPTERLRGDARLSLLSIGATLSHDLGPVRPEIGLSAVRTDVASSFTGAETGRTTRPLLPDPTWAPGVSAGISVPVAAGVGFGLRARLVRVRFRACATDAWTPFCGREWIESVSAGLEVPLR